MHRAVLISVGDDLEADAVQLEDRFGEDSSRVSAKVPASSSAGKRENEEKIQNPGAVETLIGRTIADVERDMILNTLDHCLGNRTHAAGILGISIRTLRNKLNQYKDEGANIPAAAAGGE